MKRVSLIFAVVLALMLGSGTPAAATIHPLMVGWFCGNASGDPPGQTPSATHSDQSTLRAIQSTGILTFTPTGGRSPLRERLRPHVPHGGGAIVTPAAASKNRRAVIRD